MTRRHPTKSDHYQAEPSKAHPPSEVPVVVSKNQFEGDVAQNPDAVEQCDRWDGDLRSAPSKVTVAATMATSPSGCFEAHSGKDSPGGRESPATTVASQFNSHITSSGTAYACSGPSDWRNVYGSNQQGVGTNAISGLGFDGEEEMGLSLGDNEGRGVQRARLPCHKTSSQQSEKDQRMWSALKTSLLSRSEAHADPPYENLRIGRVEDSRGTLHDDGRYVGNGSIRGNGEARGYGFLTQARDMEQLDQERSAMDRTMRPHRIASARLLETSRNSPSPNKVGNADRTRYKAMVIVPGILTAIFKEAQVPTSGYTRGKRRYCVRVRICFISFGIHAVEKGGRGLFVVLLYFGMNYALFICTLSDGSLNINKLRRFL